MKNPRLATEKTFYLSQRPQAPWASEAKTIRDDLEQVKSFGIEIADENKSYKD